MVFEVKDNVLHMHINMAADQAYKGFVSYKLLAEESPLSQKTYDGHKKQKTAALSSVASLPL